MQTTTKKQIAENFKRTILDKVREADSILDCVNMNIGSFTHHVPAHHRDKLDNEAFAKAIGGTYKFKESLERLEKILIEEARNAGGPITEDGHEVCVGDDVYKVAYSAKAPICLLKYKILRIQDGKAYYGHKEVNHLKNCYKIFFNIDKVKEHLADEVKKYLLKPGTNYDWLTKVNINLVIEHVPPEDYASE